MVLIAPSKNTGAQFIYLYGYNSFKSVGAQFMYLHDYNSSKSIYCRFNVGIQRICKHLYGYIIAPSQNVGAQFMYLYDSNSLKSIYVYNEHACIYIVLIVPSQFIVDLISVYNEHNAFI